MSLQKSHFLTCTADVCSSGEARSKGQRSLWHWNIRCREEQVRDGCFCIVTFSVLDTAFFGWSFEPLSLFLKSNEPFIRTYFCSSTFRFNVLVQISLGAGWCRKGSVVRWPHVPSRTCNHSLLNFWTCLNHPPILIGLMPFRLLMQTSSASPTPDDMRDISTCDGNKNILLFLWYCCPFTVFMNWIWNVNLSQFCCWHEFQQYLKQNARHVHWRRSLGWLRVV